MSRSARTRRSIVWPLLLAFGVTVLGSTVRAEPEAARSPGAISMTEDGLVMKALATNPDLRAGRFEQDIAEAGVSTASVVDNPVLRLEWLHAQQGDPLDSGWGARLSWTPPQPTAWSARRAQARARTTEVQEELLERAADLEASVRSGCATADALGEQLAITTRAVDTRHTIVGILQSRVERGASTRLELNAAALSSARAEQDRDAIAIARETALRQLAALAGLPGGSTLELAPDAPPASGTLPEGPPPAGGTHLEDEAVRKRPLFRADAARIEQAAQAVRGEKTRRYPWFSLSSLPRVRVTDSASRPVDLIFSVDVTLPIFDANGGRIAAAESEHKRQEALRQAHVTTLQRDIDIARNEALRRNALLARYRATIAPILEEHATLLREALQGRQLDLLALLSAEDVVVRTQREYVEARLSYRRACIHLLRVSGGLTASAAARQANR